MLCRSQLPAAGCDQRSDSQDPRPVIIARVQAGTPLPEQRTRKNRGWCTCGFFLIRLSSFLAAGTALLTARLLRNPREREDSETVTLQAEDADCNPRYGQEALIEVTVTDAAGQKVIKETALMNDAGSLTSQFAVPKRLDGLSQSPATHTQHGSASDERTLLRFLTVEHEQDPDLVRVHVRFCGCLEVPPRLEDTVWGREPFHITGACPVAPAQVSLA